MQPKYLVLIIAGVVCLTIASIDLLSDGDGVVEDGRSAPVVDTVLYFLLAIAGLVLIITGIVLHRRNRKGQKKIEDFY